MNLGMTQKDDLMVFGTLEHEMASNFLNNMQLTQHPPKSVLEHWT